MKPQKNLKPELIFNWIQHYEQKELPQDTQTNWLMTKIIKMKAEQQQEIQPIFDIFQPTHKNNNSILNFFVTIQRA